MGQSSAQIFRQSSDFCIDGGIERLDCPHISALIEATGLENAPPDYVKHLEGKLWELRLKARSGIARAICVTVTGKRVVIVKAFVKKTQKTPLKELVVARERTKELE